MMKKFFTTPLLLLHLAVFGQMEANRYLSIELDPAPFILKGYSASLKYSPKSMPKTAFMVSAFQSNFPNGMMKEVNKSRGWTDLKIQTSYALFAEFYANEERKGFYFGPSLLWYNKNVTLEQAKTSTTFRTAYPGLRAGFVWYPFKQHNFYLNPWMSAGSEISVDDKNKINDIPFELNRFNYIIALHLGFKLSK